MAYRTKGGNAEQNKLNGPGHFGLSGRGAKNLKTPQFGECRVVVEKIGSRSVRTGLPRLEVVKEKSEMV